MGNWYSFFRSRSAREAWDEFHFFNEAAQTKDHDSFRDMVRGFRKARDMAALDHEDPLARPISEGWRCYSRDGIEGYHYMIMPDIPADPWTDDEIRDYIENSPVYYGHINSPYDCTGKRHTQWCYFNRTPAGIVLIHAWGTDI